MSTEVTQTGSPQESPPDGHSKESIFYYSLCEQQVKDPEKESTSHLTTLVSSDTHSMFAVAWMHGC